MSTLDEPALGGEPPPDAPPAPPPPSRDTRMLRAAIATSVVTFVVTALSLFTPEKYAATAVGVAFLAATWLLVLRHDETVVREHGLSLGGLLEPARLEPRRLVRDGLGALAHVAALAAIIFPLFWVGYRIYWHTKGNFVWRLPPSVLDDVAGQVIVIALPEEAFFRGYLQSELDRVWAPRWRFLGANIGPALFISAALFAVGHVLTIRHPSRLAVFFPALVFGWLRARTGGIGAGVAFHASCNLFAATLARGYGIG